VVDRSARVKEKGKGERLKRRGDRNRGEKVCQREETCFEAPQKSQKRIGKRSTGARVHNLNLKKFKQGLEKKEPARTEGQKAKKRKKISRTAPEFNPTLWRG